MELDEQAQMLARVTSLEIAIIALLKTHPEPEKLAAAMSDGFREIELGATDSGFDKNLPAELVGAMILRVRKHLGGMMQLL